MKVLLNIAVVALLFCQAHARSQHPSQEHFSGVRSSLPNGQTANDARDNDIHLSGATTTSPSAVDSFPSPPTADVSGAHYGFGPFSPFYPGVGSPVYGAAFNPFISNSHSHSLYGGPLSSDPGLVNPVFTGLNPFAGIHLPSAGLSPYPSGLGFTGASVGHNPFSLISKPYGAPYGLSPFSSGFGFPGASIGLSHFSPLSKPYGATYGLPAFSSGFGFPSASIGLSSFSHLSKPYGDTYNLPAFSSALGLAPVSSAGLSPFSSNFALESSALNAFPHGPYGASFGAHTTPFYSTFGLPGYPIGLPSSHTGFGLSSPYGGVNAFSYGHEF